MSDETKARYTLVASPDGNLEYEDLPEAGERNPTARPDAEQRIERLHAVAAAITAQVEAWLGKTVEYTANWPQRAFNFDERILGGIADILHRARADGILPPLTKSDNATPEKQDENRT